MDAWILLTSQTLRTLMMKLMLCSYHSQIHGLTRARATGVEPPITPVVFWPLFWPLCGAQCHSCCPCQDPSWGTSHHSAVTRRLADHGDKSWLQKLNGIDASGMEWGWPGPLGSKFPSMMAWMINHLPSPRLMGLALRCACLPTHTMIPDNVSIVSLASPKLSLSPNYCWP